MTMENDELTRRDFVTTVAAGIVAAAGSDLAAQQQVTETNVSIKTPDGTCDAAFIHPASGSYPAVIIWPDAFGLRPSMRELAKRLAGSGYSVLVPNPFYRVGKAPMWEDASKVNFQEERPKLGPLMGSIQADGAVEKDAPAFVAWLDTQKQVDRSKKIGTQGYCMGGGLVVRTSPPIAPTARISWRRRSRGGCTSASRSTTTHSSPTPRRS
jgi:carboxymethylenebutenolidase